MAFWGSRYQIPIGDHPARGYVQEKGHSLARAPNKMPKSNLWNRAFKVKREVHRIVAKLLAWSMEWASKGQFPLAGFHDEEFPQNSFRFSKRGQSLACGWR